MTTSNPRGSVWETVLYEKKGAICHIVLNRPHKLNAANDQLNQSELAHPVGPYGSASSAHPRSCDGWGDPPVAAPARTGWPTPSTGSR